MFVAGLLKAHVFINYEVEHGVSESELGSVIKRLSRRMVPSGGRPPSAVYGTMAASRSLDDTATMLAYADNKKSCNKEAKESLRCYSFSIVQRN